MKPDYFDIAKELISFRTTSENKEELFRVVSFVENFFSRTGATIKRYEKNGKPSIVVSTEDTLLFDVILSGHLDIVPAEEEMFTPKISEEKLYGRGAADMKSEVAVMMFLVKEVLSWDSKERPKVALMLTTDEESGGMDGVEYLVDEIGYRARAVLVPDGGDDLDEVVTEAKGFAHIRISGEGVSAHGSRPWLGENAIMKVTRAAEAVRSIFSVPECCDDILDEEGHWHSTCVLGKFSGGTAVNTIPKSAECELGIRFIEPDRLHHVFSQVYDIALKNGCEAELLTGGEMRITPEDDVMLGAYRNIVEREIGIFPRLRRTHGADDGRFFARHGVPVIMSRPRSGGQHSENEWVDVNSLKDFYRIYSAFVKTFTDKS